MNPVKMTSQKGNLSSIVKLCSHALYQIHWQPSIGIETVKTSKPTPVAVYFSIAVIVLMICWGSTSALQLEWAMTHSGSSEQVMFLDTPQTLCVDVIVVTLYTLTITLL